MHECLKPGGHLFTMHSPIWSAFDGHHFPKSIPERFGKDLDPSGVIGPWEHLLFDRSQLYQRLKEQYDQSFAEEAIYWIYNSDHINRYFSEDYFQVFSDSMFNILSFEKTFSINVPQPIKSALSVKYRAYNDFENNGIYAILQNKSQPASLIF